MAHYYKTKAGDNLDWICWQYYIKEVSLGSAAMAVDPGLLADTGVLDNGFLLGPESDELAKGTVEKVLQVNPGLASYPLALPAGINILLPDLGTFSVDNASIKLWD